MSIQASVSRLQTETVQRPKVFAFVFPSRPHARSRCIAGCRPLRGWHRVRPYKSLQADAAGVGQTRRCRSLGKCGGGQWATEGEGGGVGLGGDDVHCRSVTACISPATTMPMSWRRRLRLYPLPQRDRRDADSGIFPCGLATASWRNCPPEQLRTKQCLSYTET